MITRTVDGKEIYPDQFDLVERKRTIKEGSALAKLNEAIVNYNSAASEGESSAKQRPLLHDAVIDLAKIILKDENTRRDTRQSVQNWIDQMVWPKFQEYFNHLPIELIEQRIDEGAIDPDAFLSNDISVVRINRNSGVSDVYRLSIKNAIGEESYAILKVHSQIQNPYGETDEEKNFHIKAYKNFVFNNKEARKRLGADANKIFGKIEAVRIFEQDGENKGQFELSKYYRNQTLAELLAKENQENDTRLLNTVNYLIQLLEITKKLGSHNISYLDMKPGNNNLNNYGIIKLLDGKSTEITDGITRFKMSEIDSRITDTMLPVYLQEKKAGGESIQDEDVDLETLRAAPIGITGYFFMSADPDPAILTLNYDAELLKIEIGARIKNEVIDILIKPSVTAEDMDDCLQKLKGIQAELDASRKLLRRSSSGSLRSSSNSIHRTNSNSNIHRTNSNSNIHRTNSNSNLSNTSPRGNGSDLLQRSNSGRGRGNSGSAIVPPGGRGRANSDAASTSRPTFFNKPPLPKGGSEQNMLNSTPKSPRPKNT